MFLISLDAATPRRVAGIAINNKFPREGHVDQAFALWRILDQCVVPAEQRFHAHIGSDDIPAALAKIHVLFAFLQFPNASIIKTLTTDFPALVRSLKVLTIAQNNHDESAALGAFAALATRLRELTFVQCGLTSLHGLEGHCENLRKMNLNWCKNLNSLEGLGDHLFLEEVDVSYTAITCIEPLRTCPALSIVNLSQCHNLSSIEALGDHQWLQEVDASGTAIASIDSLRTCPALTKLTLYQCQRLTSVPVKAYFLASVKIFPEIE